MFHTVDRTSERRRGLLFSDESTQAEGNESETNEGEKEGKKEECRMEEPTIDDSQARLLFATQHPFSLFADLCQPFIPSVCLNLVIPKKLLPRSRSAVEAE